MLAPQLKASGGPWTVKSAESDVCPPAVATTYAVPTRPPGMTRAAELKDWPGPIVTTESSTLMIVESVDLTRTTREFVRAWAFPSESSAYTVTLRTGAVVNRVAPQQMPAWGVVAVTLMFPDAVHPGEDSVIVAEPIARVEIVK